MVLVKTKAIAWDEAAGLQNITQGCGLKLAQRATGYIINGSLYYTYFFALYDHIIIAVTNRQPSSRNQLDCRERKFARSRQSEKTVGSSVLPAKNLDLLISSNFFSCRQNCIAPTP